MKLPNPLDFYIHIVLGEALIEVEHIQGNPPATMDTLAFEPVVAVRSEPRASLVAFGRAEVEQARCRDAMLLVHDLANHPRVLMADFELYEETLKQAKNRLVSRRSFFNPVIVIHQADRVEGGLSPVEVRALTELGESIGGRRVRVRTGRRLSPDDFRDLDRVTDGWCEDPLYRR